jgi:hypothetical protein
MRCDGRAGAARRDPDANLGHWQQRPCGLWGGAVVTGLACPESRRSPLSALDSANTGAMAAAENSGPIAAAEPAGTGGSPRHIMMWRGPFRFVHLVPDNVK